MNKRLIYCLIAAALAVVVLAAATITRLAVQDMADVPPMPPPSTGVGDTIEFGGRNWLVLDVRDGHALIITERIVGQSVYHLLQVDVTWATSSIRAYLHHDFLNSFSETDRARIRETTMVNDDNPWFGINGGGRTADMIFLLSLEEVVRYFGDSGRLADQHHEDNHWWGFLDQYNRARMVQNAEGLYREWWLRSPGISGHSAALVDADGRILVGGNPVIISVVGIRPALWLNLD